MDELIQQGVTSITELAVAAARQTWIEQQAEFEENTIDFPVDQWKHFGRPTKAKPNGEDWHWFVAEGIPSAVNAYITWRLQSRWKLARLPMFGDAIEVPFEAEFGGVPVHGFIDRVFEIGPERKLAVVDIKTGSKPKSSEQLGLYARALEAAQDRPVELGYYLYGLKFGEVKVLGPLDLSMWTAANFADAYQKADAQINAGQFTPNVGDHCFSICSVNRSCTFFRGAT